MKTTSKRILSMLLVFVMVFSLLPGYALAADEQPVIDFDPFAELENEAAADDTLAAAGGEGAEVPEEEIIEEDIVLGEEEIVTMATTKDFTGSTVADLGISATDATGSGTPTCSWVASGTNITGSLVGGTGKKTIVYYYYESTTELTLTNNKATEAELSFKYSATTSGSDYGDITVNGTQHTSSVTNGEVSVTLAAGGSITIKLHVPQISQAFSQPDANGASISISDIKLVGQGSVTVNFGAAENGSYTVTDAAGAAVTVPGEVSAKSTDRLTMTATPADGYVFAGWYQTVDGVTTALSADLSYTTLFENDATVKPMFMPAADGVYGVGDAVFTDLTAAATAAASSTTKTVVLLKDATLTGSHTIPMGVTLLIPYNAEHTLNTSDPDSETVDHFTTSAANYVAYEKPSAFRTLTMASGSSITVKGGAISVNAKHESCVGGQIYGGQVLGKYGAIYMNSGSSITLENGSNLYAWGYIWGDGTVEALSGATVYEKMQVTDYRGGTNTSVIALRNGSRKTDGAFPFNQYYIQNVEVKEVLHAGAIVMAHAAVNLSGETPVEAAVEFIGTSSAMFTVSGATITKEYHPETDRLSLSIDGDENSYMELNGMKLSMGTLNIDSANYTLPINGNIDININAGAAVVNQEVVLQPGVKVYVDSDAMLATNANIYVMDLDQWGNFVFSEKRQQAVVYSPSLGGGSSRTISSDAVIDINGYVMPIGGLFTTAGGAQIISSGKTGIIEYGEAAPADSSVYQLTGGSDKYQIAVTSAQLTNQNLNTPFTATKGAAEGDIFFYHEFCETWHRETDACADVIEVTWAGLGFTADFTEEYATGTVPTYKGETPTKAASGCISYVFAGWSTEANGGGEVYTGELPVVTGDATYYAYFTESANHNWKNATCTAPKTCSVCGATEGEANGHSYVASYQWNTSAGGIVVCTANGTCSVCKGTTSISVSTRTEAVTGNVTTDANCVTEKVTTYTADFTGTEAESWAKNPTEYKVTGEKDSSKHTNVVTDAAVAPGCDSPGKTEGSHCDGCQTVIVAQDVVNALGHIDENTDHKCERDCGKTDMGTHADSATDSDHVCDYGCGAVLENCSDAAGDKDHNCDVCGKENVTDHTYGNATCDAPATCSECGATTGTALGHDWTVTYNFAEDGSSCTATRSCTRDASHNVTATAKITSAEKTAATCEGVGTTTYTATFTEDWAETQTKDVQDITAKDHAWTVTYNFAADGSSCTATRVCGNDDSHNVTAAATISSAEKSPATCEGMGTTTYTATFAETWATTQTKDVQDIAAKGHAWTVTYNFAEDGKSCTATRTCANDASHNVTATATISSAVKTPATCEGMGTTTYTASFTETWAETQTKDVQDIVATDHAWTVTYDFAEDGKSCTATRVCGNDDSHNVTATAKISSEEKSPATCEVMGTTTYTATFTETWAETQTKDVQDIEAKDHAWTVTYNFAADGSSCTATRSCANDASHNVTATATISSAEKTAATCEGMGTTTYTATFTEDWAETQTKDVQDIAAKGHDWGEPDSYTINDDGTHTANYVCGNDKSHTKSDAAETHSYVDGVCVCKDVQTFTVTWVVDGETVKTETVEYGKDATAPEVKAKEGHSFAWDNDGKAIKGNTTITGTYTVNSYDYTIKTYTMGLDGVYGEPVTEIKTAVYGSTVSVNPEAEAGFTVDTEKSVTSAIIGTDGATLSVYYIRNKYTITYISYTDHVYDQAEYYYGAEIQSVDAPLRNGYTFKGWGSEIPETMPAGNVTVIAIWEANSYTITWDYGDGNTITNTQTSGEKLVLPATPEKTGYTFTAWYTAPEGGYKISTNSVFDVMWGYTYYARYTVNSYNYTIETYTMGTDGEYGEPVTETKTAVYGSTVSVTPETKTGFTVDTVNSVTSASNGTGETVLKVYYIRNQYSVNYQVDDAEHKTETYYYEAPINALAAPTKEGHTFSGWSDIPATMPAWDVTVTGSFTVNSYKLTYMVDGEVYSETTVPYGTAITALAAPTKAYDESHHYVFSGWSEIPAAMPAEDVTITGSFTAVEHNYKVSGEYSWTGTESCTVTGKCDCGHSVTATATIRSEEWLPATCEGVGTTTYTASFAETWAEEQTKDVQDLSALGHAWGEPTYTIDEENGTHTANYVCGNDETHTKSDAAEGHTYTDGVCVCGKVQTFTVTWVVDGKTVKTETVEYGKDATAPGVEAKEGHSFAWSNDGKAIKADTTIKGTYTVNQYEVKWSIGGEVVYSETKDYGEDITAPEVTVPENYYKVQWNNIPKTMPAENITIEGDWMVFLAIVDENNNTLSFELYTLGSQASTGGTKLNFSKEGHSFYLANINDESERYALGYSSGMPEWPWVTLNGNLTLKPLFVPNQYTVTLMLEDVQYGKVLTVTYGQTMDVLEDVPTPSKDKEGCTAYSFSGWFDDETQYNVSSTMPAKNLTLNAKFSSVIEHSGGPVYTDNGNGTHTARFSCCGAEHVTDKAHSYSEDTHKCVCGAVESFTIEWYTKDSEGHYYFATTTQTYGESIVLPEGTPEMYSANGMQWKFEGWYTGEFDGEKVGGTYDTAGDSVFYAHFAQAYKVIWNCDAVVLDSQYYYVGEAMELPAVPAKTGYHVIYEMGSFSSGNYLPENPVYGVNVAPDKPDLYCIYVKYMPNAYQLTLIGGEGCTWVTGGSDAYESVEKQVTKSVNYDAVIDYTYASMSPQKEGYKLDSENTFSYMDEGYLKPVGKVDGQYRYTWDSNMTLYLNWVLEEYSIMFYMDHAVSPYGHVGAKFHMGDTVPEIDYPSIKVYPGLVKEGYTLSWKFVTESDWWDAAGNSLDEMIANAKAFDIENAKSMPAESILAFAVYTPSGWVEIEGEWYYMDPETGEAAKGVSRVPYPTEEINGVSYVPDQESIKYAESKNQTFIDAETGLFVFDEEGKFQSGTTGIVDGCYVANGHIAWHPGMVESNGSYYYFIGDSEKGGNKLATGDVYVSRNTTDRKFVEGGLYTFGADGKLCEYDGITSVNGVLRYYKNAQLMLGAGLVQVGENYIYVRSTGELVVNTEYWVPANEMNIEKGMYSFDANGYLVIPEVTLKEGVYYEDGGWYLYENGVKAYNSGLVSAEGLNWYGEDGSVSYTGVQGEYIYVRSNAQLATGTYYVTNVGENSIVAKGTKCSFSDIGIYATGKDGIVGGYYYKNNQIVYGAGLIEYNGGLIYVRSNGQVVMGQVYWITNTNGLKSAGFYEFDENGYMVVDSTKEGIVEENGALYYYVGGVKQMGTGLIELDGGYIYVRTNGALAVGVYWITNNNGIDDVPAGKYTFGADGYMVQ